MKSLWYRSSIGVRIIAGVVAALLIAGLAIAAVTWLGTDHGSDAFNHGFALSRLILQISAAVGIISVLAIFSRRNKPH